MELSENEIYTHYMVVKLSNSQLYIVEICLFPTAPLRYCVKEICSFKANYKTIHNVPAPISTQPARDLTVTSS